MAYEQAARLWTPPPARVRSATQAVELSLSVSPSSSTGSDMPEFVDLQASGVSSPAPLGERGTTADTGAGASPADLPHEILMQILGHCSGEQRDLLSCLLVCRRWCACGVQLLWHRPYFHRLSALFKMIHVMIQPEASFPYALYIRRLNFSLLAGDLNDHLFGRMAVCHRLERLTLSGCCQITDHTLVRVLQNTPHLVAMDVSGVVQLTDRTLHQLAATCPKLQGANLSGCELITSDGVKKIAQSCHSLRRIKLAHCVRLDSTALPTLLHACPLLLEADLAGCTGIDDESVRAVWQRPTLLRELRLAGCTSLTDRAFCLQPTPTEAQEPRGAPVCEHLRMLDLSGCPYLSDEAVHAVVAHAPRLRHLILAKCARLTEASVYAIAELGRHLQHLHLAHCTHLTDRAMVHLAQHCTRIRYLDLACCVQLTDDGIAALAAHLPKLRRIGLVRLANLTDRAVYALVERHTSLERIHLSYCEQITVPAIFWLLLRLPRLTHLSLTGVPAFRRPDLQAMCRAPPKEFNQHQRQSFCVYSGRGVHELRRFLQRVYADPVTATQYGALPPEQARIFFDNLQRFVAPRT